MYELNLPKIGKVVAKSIPAVNSSLSIQMYSKENGLSHWLFIVSVSLSFNDLSIEIDPKKKIIWMKNTRLFMILFPALNCVRKNG